MRKTPVITVGRHSHGEQLEYSNIGNSVLLLTDHATLFAVLKKEYVTDLSRIFIDNDEHFGQLAFVRILYLKFWKIFSGYCVYFLYLPLFKIFIFHFVEETQMFDGTVIKQLITCNNTCLCCEEYHDGYYETCLPRSWLKKKREERAT